MLLFFTKFCSIQKTIAQQLHNNCTHNINCRYNDIMERSMSQFITETYNEYLARMLEKIKNVVHNINDNYAIGSY